MITKSDLELICNYCEIVTKGEPIFQVTYKEFIKDTDEIKRRVIMERREKVIDVILDNRVEELEKFKKDNIMDDFAIPSIFQRSVTKNLNAKKFISYDDLWDEVTKRLEHLTTIKQQSSHISKADLEYDGIFRRIINRCLMLSNIIDINSYRGPATSIIVGKDIIPYMIISSYMSSPSSSSNRNILGKVGELNVIASNNISPNKVIVIKTENKLTTGLLVVKSSNHDQYFIDELGNWQDKIEWFEVI